MRQVIHSDKAPAAIGPYSQAIGQGDMIFTSGQIPLDPKTGDLVGTEIRAQAQQALRNLQAVLEEAGSDFDHVVKTTCFLADMGDFAAFNEVYSSFIQSAPARSCVAVRSLPKGALVEVECVAVRKQA